MGATTRDDAGHRLRRVHPTTARTASSSAGTTCTAPRARSTASPATARACTACARTRWRRRARGRRGSSPRRSWRSRCARSPASRRPTRGRRDAPDFGLRHRAGREQRALRELGIREAMLTEMRAQKAWQLGAGAAPPLRPRARAGAPAARSLPGAGAQAARALMRRATGSCRFRGYDLDADGTDGATTWFPAAWTAKRWTGCARSTTITGGSSAGVPWCTGALQRA